MGPVANGAELDTVNEYHNEISQASSGGDLEKDLL